MFCDRRLKSPVPVFWDGTGSSVLSFSTDNKKKVMHFPLEILIQLTILSFGGFVVQFYLLPPLK